MDVNESNTISSEDISNWLQSVKEYIKGTEANCLDLRAIPFKLDGLKITNIQAIFDSLIDSGITDIHLEGNVLTNKIHGLSAILSQTKLKILNLRACSLLTDDFFSVILALKDTKVSELDVSKNKIEITEGNMDEFVGHLVNSHLTSLNLGYNSVLPSEAASSLFKGLQDTSITCLNLTGVLNVKKSSSSKSYNVLSNLFSNLQNTVLTDLSLRSNQIDDSSMKLLGKVLQNSNLEKLDISVNSIGDPGIDFLVTGLVHSKITHLNLSGNNIVGDNSLSECLGDTLIRVLNLSANPITNGRIFSGNHFLKRSAVDTLILTDCDNLVPSNISLIKELRFSHLTALEWMNHKFNPAQVSALADLLSNSNITFINLSGSEFWEECFFILADCLKEAKLKHIRVSQTSDWADTTPGIALLLEKTKGSSLVFVDISSHAFGPAGAKTIAPSLANTTLRALDISGNSIQIITSLITQLKHTKITYLNLSHNLIEDEGAAVLANCLPETQVIVLNLGSNSITSHGAKCIASTLRAMKLRHLNLDSNQIEDDGIETLAEQARNTCITFLNVKNNPGKRKILVDIVLWKNRRKIQEFADLLKRTPLFAGDSIIFKCDRVLDNNDILVFIEDCLKIYKTVCEQPFIVDAIEQDKFILDLKSLKCFERNPGFSDGEPNVFIGDCSAVYENVLEKPFLLRTTVDQDKNISLFNKQILWLMLEQFPKQFVSFIGRDIEADAAQHVSLLKRIEELELTGLVELLLLNRPLYTIDENEEILHPYVYVLLYKYKQPLYNLAIEPRGKEKITDYFAKNIHLDGASEVISLLSSKGTS